MFNFNTVIVTWVFFDIPLQYKDLRQNILHVIHQFRLRSLNLIKFLLWRPVPNQLISFKSYQSTHKILVPKLISVQIGSQSFTPL